MKTGYNKGIIDQLRKFLADELDNLAAIKRWSMEVSAFLNTALGADEAANFSKLKNSNEYDEYALRVGHLQGIISKAEAKIHPAKSGKNPIPAPSAPSEGGHHNERLRQERETFNQHKDHQNHWFRLRLVMGYTSVILLLAIMGVSTYILFNISSFSGSVVTAAGAALFVDSLGLVVSIWKIVFNPDFMTKLAPIAGNQPFSTSTDRAISKAPNNEGPQLTILEAKYGIEGKEKDVKEILQGMVSDNKLETNVTNVVLGPDPACGNPKVLNIVFSFAGETRSITIPENGRLTLPVKQT